ncbi:hypothetical protein ACSQ67_005929 [Phaseolus vulgaris]
MTDSCYSLLKLRFSSFPITDLGSNNFPRHFRKSLSFSHRSPKFILSAISRTMEVVEGSEGSQGSSSPMKLLFVEMGVGYDQHGQDITVAAMRACKDAISSNSIPAFRRGTGSGIESRLDTLEHMFQEVVRDREKAENEQLERFQRLEDLISGLTVVVEKLTCGSKSMADHNKIIKRTAIGEGEEVWQPHFQSWRRKLDIPVFAGEEAFEDIKVEVKLYGPTNLVELMMKAQMVEDKIRTMTKGGGTIENKSSRGASHNFISEELMLRCRLELVETLPYVVEVADGHKVQCQGKCMGVSSGSGSREGRSKSSSSALGSGSIPGVSFDQMKLQIKLGVPHSLQKSLDIEKVKSVFPYGEILNVEVVDGGLICSSGVLVEEMGDKNDDCYIVNAAVYVGYKL